MALFDDLLELLGLGGITGLDVVFAGMAIAGTLLFIVYFGLVLIGGVADGALDAVGIDVDFGMDSAEGSFQMLTVQGILSFVMMFGIFGLATPQADQHNIIAVGVGGVAGVISMWLVGKVFQVMMSLRATEPSATTTPSAPKEPFTERFETASPVRFRWNSKTPCEPVKPLQKTRN